MEGDFSGGRKPMTCFKCGGEGHRAVDCTQAGGDSRGGRGGGGALTCHKCGQAGHFARECPSAGGDMRGGGAPDSRACFNCGGPHLARDCPTKQEGGFRGGRGGDRGRGFGGSRGGFGDRGFGDRGGRGGRGGGGDSRACFRCGQEGHMSFECTQPRQQTKCYNCGGTDGHMSKDCPEPRRN